jgi:hypothetical protein
MYLLLGDFLRQSRASARVRISLADELALGASYLEIERVRWLAAGGRGGRRRGSSPLPRAAAPAPTLLENAIVRRRPSPGGATVRSTARQSAAIW